MKVLLSISSWESDGIKEQQKWLKTNPAYRPVINKLTVIGGKFVAIPAEGEPFITKLLKEGKVFPQNVDRVSTMSVGKSLEFCQAFTEEDPKRYQLCTGYTLVTQGELDSWTKHYWIWDKKVKSILEGTKLKVYRYYGIHLEQSDWKALPKVISVEDKAPPTVPKVAVKAPPVATPIKEDKPKAKGKPKEEKKAKPKSKSKPKAKPKKK